MIKIDNQKDKRKLTPLKTASACLFRNWLWFLFSKVLFYLQFFANSIDNIINNFRSNADVVERSENLADFFFAEDGSNTRIFEEAVSKVAFLFIGFHRGFVNNFMSIHTADLMTELDHHCFSSYAAAGKIDVAEHSLWINMNGVEQPFSGLEDEAAGDVEGRHIPPVSHHAGSAAFMLRMLAVDGNVGQAVDYPSHTHNGFVVVWISLLRHGGGAESSGREVLFDLADFLFVHALEVEADSGAAGA